MSVTQKPGKIFDSIVNAVRVLDMKLHLTAELLTTITAEFVPSQNADLDDKYYPKQKWQPFDSGDLTDTLPF
jgi:hypothetical protein